MTLFADRDDAGTQLAGALADFADRPGGVVVLGLPRGGVVVAARIAERLNAHLDVVVVRKLATPARPEIALGAIALWSGRVALARVERVIEQTDVRAADFDVIRRHEVEVAHRRALEWQPAAPELAGRAVLLIDDGLATGATLTAAADAVHTAGPARLVAGVPVGPAQELRELAAHVDEIRCLLAPADFRAVSAYYRDFRPVADATVAAELDQARRRRG